MNVQRNDHPAQELSPAYQASPGGLQQPSLLLTIPQTAQQLGLSQAKVYALIATEQLPTVRFGRAVRVPYQSLQQWIQKREQEQNYE